MKNTLKIILVCMLVSLGLMMLYLQSKLKPSARYQVAVIQTASHPALDAASNGFVDQLKKALGDEVSYRIYNAEGSAQQAHTIMSSIQANRSISLLYAIGTLAAQSAVSMERNRPIIIAAVTDPRQLTAGGIPQNICGYTDMINISHQITSMQKLIPHLKKVALLYSSAEANSQVVAGLMEKELVKRGLVPVKVGVTSEADVAQATEKACKIADAVLIPTDNTLASAITLVGSIARAYKTPLIASHKDPIHAGALLAIGVDYYTMGQQSGLRALDILVHQKSPGALGIHALEEQHLYINQNVAQRLAIEIPEEFKQE